MRRPKHRGDQQDNAVVETDRVRGAGHKLNFLLDFRSSHAHNLPILFQTGSLIH
jgi:hypothetical protein